MGKELQYAIGAVYVTDTHIRVTVFDRAAPHHRVQFALTSDKLMEFFKARRSASNCDCDDNTGNKNSDYSCNLPNQEFQPKSFDSGDTNNSGNGVRGRRSWSLRSVARKRR